MAVLAALTLTGCQQQPITDPVAEALRPAASSSRRVAAVRATRDADAPDLMPLVLSSRHPLAVRQAAADRMIRADADAFWQAAASNIRRIDDWPMLTLLCDRAAADGQHAFVPGLIESWARPSIRYTDGQRPERIALQRLSPAVEPVAVLWEFAASPSQATSDRRTGVAAWTILARTLPQDELRAGIDAHHNSNELIGQLQLASQAVSQLPRDREELLRLKTLRQTSTDQDWAHRAEVCGNHVETAGPPNLALRHLPAIDHSSGAELAVGRADRMRALSTRLASARRVTRGEGSDRVNLRTTPDTLADHADALGWADLLVVQQILDALSDPALAAALFTQADRDLLDTETELGGVLTWDETGHVVAQPFDPLMRRHDEIYIASDDCITAMHNGLAHYHFHAQRHDNAEWAGPGGGDFTFANNLHANCVVFTFIDRDTLNADLYFPAGVVIDLGCIHR